MGANFDTCPHCGCGLKKGEKRCPNCGKPV